jgi:hypothetical protein
MTMLFVRAATVLLCYVVGQAVTLNHFLYTLLKDRYLSYQVPFYVVLFAASLLVGLPWNVSRARWQVVVLMCVVGYLSSSIAFFIEPTIRYGLSGTRSPIFYRELFIAPVFSLGWLFGGMAGIVMVTLERHIVVRLNRYRDRGKKAGARYPIRRIRREG